MLMSSCMKNGTTTIVKPLLLTDDDYTTTQIRITKCQTDQL